MQGFQVTPESLDRFKRRWRDLSKDQVPFATALMLTWTGQDIKKAERAEMLRVFDNPTAFTLNSLYLTPATKKKHEALVWFKDYAPKGTAAAKYLQPQVVGGIRQAKRYEKALRRKGMLPAGKITVPGAGARLTKGGNISRGQITRMLSNLDAQHDSGQNTGSRGTRRNGRQASARNYFVKRNQSGMPIAIYIRAGRRRAKPFLIFASDAKYHQRFDFFGVASDTRDKRLNANWARAWKQANKGRR